MTEPATRKAPQTPEQEAIQASVELLLQVLDLEPVGSDCYRGISEARRFPRIFGGQVLSQALLAASRTVPAEKAPHSLHAYFLESGTPGKAIFFDVERVRDGRSFSARRVTARQGPRPILQLSASFHVEERGPEYESAAPQVADPLQVPALRDRIQQIHGTLPERARFWLERPPPVEFRTDDPPGFLGGPTSVDPRLLWIRIPRRLADDPLLHRACIAYASDYMLVDIVARRGLAERELQATSLDHAIWFHRFARADEWLLYAQESPIARAGRGLARAALYDEQRRLVASVSQEVLVRPVSPAPERSLP